MTDTPGGEAAADPETARLKRLRIRCWRRGIKEMDLLLGPYADALLAGTIRTDLDAFEALIAEGDQELYRWLSGAAPGPEDHAAALAAVMEFHGIAGGKVAQR
ncbi:MAG: succinate dehydrogenase assembly factor 2 [Pseudomonadota bacterium]